MRVKVTIESRSGLAAFFTSANDRILFAGLEAGLALPYDCATGTCGMCKARLKSGTVEAIWPEAPATRKLQRDKGDLLMCQYRATSDCTLRVPGNVVAMASHVPKQVVGRLRSMRSLTADVMEFEITLPQPMLFQAGQFVVLAVGQLAGGRAYSMVTYAPDCATLGFVIKKKPGGALSDWLFSADRTGEPISVFGPLGRATFRPQDDGDLVCIAGGSGIAGILSILDHAIQVGHFQRYRARVFFGVRTLADGFYLDRFSNFIQASRGGLEVVLAVSDQIATTPWHPAFSTITLASGYVHDVADALLDRDCSHMTSFVAGPPVMVDGAIRALIGHGVPSALIRYDRFG